MSNWWFASAEGYLTSFYDWKNNGGERKVYIKSIQFMSWVIASIDKVSSFIIHKIYCCFSLFFNVLVDVVRKFLSCFMMMIFLWLLKSWSCLLKCLHTGIALVFLIYQRTKCCIYIYIYICIYIYILLLIYFLAYTNL